MKTTSLEILETASLPAEQARAILKVMEMEIAELDEKLVTKGELHAVELKLEQVRTEVRAMGTKLVLWMFGMFLTLAGLMITLDGFLFTALSHRHS